VPQHVVLDALAIRRAFNRAAAKFDTAAVLCREVRERALARLRLVRYPPDVVLDLGAGTTAASRVLAKEYPRARVLALDSSMAMLRAAPKGLRHFFAPSVTRVAGNAQTLPIRNRSVDWLFSNLLLPWCAEPETALAEMRRVLKPGGLLACTSFGPDTLMELRSSWDHDPLPHAYRFPDMHDLGDALVRLGFADPVLDTERFTLTYADLFSLARDLQAMGSVNAFGHRARGLSGTGNWNRAAQTYERYRVHGKLPATFEIVYAQAWVPLVERHTDGEIRVPVSALRGKKS
jgi:malonyl-CoA O-methyltransferase